jgi:uncharacterized protein (TIGR02001 family)
MPSCAQDRAGGSLVVTSDYVNRGISQTRGEPAVQADLHYMSTQGWSIGLWGSTIELNWWDGRTVELDAYLGYRWAIDRDWTAKVSAVHYAYPWNSNKFNYDYDELIGSVGYRNTLFVTVAYSFDTSRYSTIGYVASKDAISYEAAVALPLGRSFTANFGVGYFDLHNLVDSGYLYWNAGVSYDWRSWRADLSYIGTDAKAERLFFGNVAGDRAAASLSWRF